MGADDNQAMSETVHPTLPLPDLVLISVEGPDAGTFLQGQLTQDVLSLEPSQARPGGYCSAKGRLLANFVILRPQPETWWLITRASIAESLVKRLRMFVLRARCTLQVRSDLGLFGAWSERAPLWQVHRDAAPETETTTAIGWFGGRTLLIGSPGAGPAAADPTHWARADIEAGWPWIEPATADQFVPQMVNFELLGGVNFRKGCYPGQEVVARSQYRGILKRRMAACTVQGPDAAPAAGAEVFHSEDREQPAGMVVNAAPAAHGDNTDWALLIEVKTAATAAGHLHLSSPDGPILQLRPLPYAVPAQAQD